MAARSRSGSRITHVCLHRVDAPGVRRAVERIARDHSLAIVELDARCLSGGDCGIPKTCRRGISAGIDMALKVVARYFGENIARATARHMEYPYPDSNDRRIPL